MVAENLLITFTSGVEAAAGWASGVSVIGAEGGAAGGGVGAGSGAIMI
jgi:hypothetical protein